MTLAAIEAAEAPPPATSVDAFTRRKPARRPLPDHLPRVRQVYPSPLACPCCAGRLHKLGEDVTKSETARAMDYGLKRMPAFTRFLDDGRICLSNNAAERAMRCVAIGRKNWTFAGSDAGGRRAASI